MGHLNEKPGQESAELKMSYSRG